MLLRRLWRYIPQKRKPQLALLMLLSFVVSCAEVASIGAILPFLGALIAPENILSTYWGQKITEILGTKDQAKLLLAMTVLFASASLFAGAIRLMQLFAQTRICYAIGADLSLEIYVRLVKTDDEQGLIYPRRHIGLRRGRYCCNSCDQQQT